jgi:predicted nucleotidyltransferase
MGNPEGIRMNINQAIQEFKKRLKEVYKDNLKEVILFGSAARGEFTGGSDIDVLVVLGSIPDREEESNKIFRIQREVEKSYEDKIIISATLTTRDDYDSRLDPLYLNVKKEGVPL